MGFMYITASVTLHGICAYHMLQVGGREEICIIRVVSSRGKRVSIRFDSSHEIATLWS